MRPLVLWGNCFEFKKMSTPSLDVNHGKGWKSHLLLGNNSATNIKYLDEREKQIIKQQILNILLKVKNKL